MSGSKKAKKPEEKPKKNSLLSIIGWFVIAALAGFLTPWLLQMLGI